MTLPVAQPAYILRGHASQIHATAFIRSNARLVTGDAEGWIVVWSLATKRPAAVWRAHEASILGVRAWGRDKLITHGKDNKLIVWKFSEDDESSMSTILPVDPSPESRRQPWIANLLEVNTMNFCSFSSCPALPTPTDSPEELLIAVPNTLSSESVDIFHLPTSKRIHTIPGSGAFKGGMVMAISLLHHPTNANLTVISGFESGHTSITQLISSTWTTLYIAQPHLQPILSISLSPLSTSSQDKEKDLYYLTSSADSIIAKHPIPSSSSNNIIGPILPLKTVQTKHAGQQSLQVRDDGKIFATAGWDSKVRVYSGKGMKELAVLKWHKEGCYSVSFADVGLSSSPSGEGEGSTEGGEGMEIAGVEKSSALSVMEERRRKAVTTHWLAVGSKDGKVSLWDIY